MIIDTKELFQPGIDEFAGLNQRTRDLPKRCFISNDEIIFSDVVIDKMTAFICNIKSNTNNIHTFYDTENCFTILDVSNKDGLLIASKSRNH